MQNKFVAILLVVLCLISLTLAGYFYFSFHLNQPERSLRPLDHVSKVSRNELESMKRLSQNLTTLAVSAKPSIPATNIHMFGYREPLPVIPVKPVIQQPTVIKAVNVNPLPVKIKTRRRIQKPSFNYKVSMTYASSGSRYAVVNDAFVQPGHSLHDGTKIINITETAVLLEKQGFKQWLSVKP